MTWKVPPKSWSESVAERAATSIKAARERTKTSAAKLSERTAELGAPVSRSVLSDLETGRKRSLDVSELLVIAAALGVPPIFLLYPGLSDDQIDVLPGLRSSSRDAARWFNGEAITATNNDDRDEQRLAHFDDMARELVEAFAQLARLDEAITATVRTLPTGDDGHPVDDGRLDGLMRNRDELRVRIADLDRAVHSERARIARSERA
ncbi:helix-turn-helix domain-containing protein [Gordonia sp. PP30]|uniref:helix-turn-helix domain-containing protein n=1 Tax=Gordonia sp. PP30 TaxID=2935861 RepID=UPI001FFE3D87|nr:helix-turn-helix transcriptional regulator [Gordonia sp. PP30]UQE74705.1 helix-turn-helix domain-containing protein [Gordonia sp. PP30]